MQQSTRTSTSIVSKWAPDLRQRLAELATELKIDISGRLKNAEAPKRSTPEAVAKAQTMPPEDRTAMIRGMVEGLSERLDKSPRDAEGWIKLIRSRKVLGEPDKAREALDRALEGLH